MFRSSANCSVMTELPNGAGGGHLLQAGHLSELPLERRGDRRGHHVRAGAGIEREHLDGRIVDLRQRGDRQLPVRDEAGQQNADHQQRGRDRPQDERPRGAHGRGLRGAVRCAAPLAPGRAAAVRRCPSGTIPPGRRWRRARLRPRLDLAAFLQFVRPSMTTMSPAATPLVTSTSSPSVMPSVTGRIRRSCPPSRRTRRCPGGRAGSPAAERSTTRVQRIEQQAGIHELIRKQRVVRVAEDAPSDATVPVAGSIWLSTVSSVPVASLILVPRS